MLSDYLDVLARTYDGSDKSALEISSEIAWVLQFDMGNRGYAKRKVLPAFINTRKALKNTLAENREIVEGVLEKVNWGIRVVRHYIKTGEIRAVSKRRFRELLRLANIRT